eukprot:5604307-Prymnesium_polylepis.1
MRWVDELDFQGALPHGGQRSVSVSLVRGVDAPDRAGHDLHTCQDAFPLRGSRQVCPLDGGRQSPRQVIAGVPTRLELAL